MHDFLAALAPEPFRVLGRSLRPLSYGHVVLLNRLGLDPVQSVQDLFAATRICERTYRDGLAYVSELMTAAGGVKLEEGIENAGGIDLRQAFQAWAAYMESGSSHPEYCKVKGSSSDRGAPFLAQLRGMLLGQCNYSPDYLMDAPYGQCLWDYGCAIESANGWGIVGEEHREIAKLLNSRN